MLFFLLLAASQVAQLTPAAATAAEGLPGATVISGGSATAGEREHAGSRREPSPAQYLAAREQCRADPEKCREVKARVEQRREQCRADPGKCRAEQQARQQERFRRADTDGNNALSRDEAAKSARALARHFDRIDANRDGQLTIEEIQAARKARQDARHRQAG